MRTFNIDKYQELFKTFEKHFKTFNFLILNLKL